MLIIHTNEMTSAHIPFVLFETFREKRCKHTLYMYIYSMRLAIVLYIFSYDEMKSSQMPKSHWQTRTYIHFFCYLPSVGDLLQTYYRTCIRKNRQIPHLYMPPLGILNTLYYKECYRHLYLLVLASKVKKVQRRRKNSRQMEKIVL